MGANSNIEWTDHTFNPWRGCTKVSQGCKNCYAETLSKRFDNVHGIWGPKGTRPIAAESYWTQPLRWNKKAEQEGIRRRVFCGSLCDFFEGFQTMPEEAYDPTIVARERTFKLVDQTPWLDWLFLTKRPENILELSSYIVDCTGANVQKNAWFGTSVEDQETADSRIPEQR